MANQLTLEFGKGFNERNLNNMKAFFSSFPIWNAVHTELSWTHYRIISELKALITGYSICSIISKGTGIHGLCNEILIVNTLEDC
ncbi:DUF1016 domain-containing protein [Elizabethkingia anophelis]|nr:DUF1016 domain-containing protein [Elizabethkingia anophelis]